MNEYGDGEKTIAKYYKIVYAKDIFYCPDSDIRDYVENGVMAEFDDEMQMCHRSAVKHCDKCGKLIAYDDRDICWDCEW